MTQQISGASIIDLSSPPDKVNFFGMRPDVTTSGAQGRINRRPVDMADRQLMEDYFRGQEGIAAVFLFGSRAAGRPRPDSDIDLAVLFGAGTKKEWNLLRDRFSNQLTRKLKKDLHLVVLDDAGEMLLKQILNKGICLCNNDPKALARFRIAALSRIFDYQHYYRYFATRLQDRILGEERHG